MSHIQIDVRFRRPGFDFDVQLPLARQGVTVILGPSGCGKTTLLRLIAGLEKPADGQIKVGSAIWADSHRRICRPPQQRRVGMVFQDYALFNHLSVAGNIGFGLPSTGRQARVGEWLERLHLEGLAERYPHQLSGGQRQRVALARALATEPDLLLLDEPFAALDTHLRRHLREQLLEVIDQLQQPALMVTHDLEETRYLADTIGVMIEGRIERLGAAPEVFADPGSVAVARVMGWQNFLPVGSIEGPVVAGDWGQLRLEHEPGADIAWLAIRPEHLRWSTGETQGLSGRVIRVTELGGLRELVCRLAGGHELRLQRPWSEPVPAAGSQLRLHVPLQHVRLLVENGPAMDTKSPNEAGNLIRTKTRS